MVKTTRIILSSVPSILAALAFAFSITATTSRDWVRQHHYDRALDMKQWETPIFTTYRSPFIVCTPGSTTVGNVTTYTLNCNKFRPYGRGKTSCELVSVTQDYNNAITGDERLCQQIHYAGNLAIASCVFIGVGFLMLLGLTLFYYTAFRRSSPARSEDPVEEGAQLHGTGALSRRSPVAAWINFVVIIALSFGAVLYLLSQFYGVVGLVQSQPDNGVFASNGGANPDPTVDNSHGPWVQGKAVTRFATLAWLCSALAAAAAMSVWRLPKRSLL